MDILVHLVSGCLMSTRNRWRPGAEQGPADIAVEEVHAILRQIVARTIESEECKGLAQFTHLKREIATTAASSLESMKVCTSKIFHKDC